MEAKQKSAVVTILMRSSRLEEEIICLFHLLSVSCESTICAWLHKHKWLLMRRISLTSWHTQKCWCGGLWSLCLCKCPVNLSQTCQYKYSQPVIKEIKYRARWDVWGVFWEAACRTNVELRKTAHFIGALVQCVFASLSCVPTVFSNI